MFRLVLGIEVIKIAEKLIKAMHGWQKFVAVSEMVLAKLAGSVA